MPAGSQQHSFFTFSFDLLPEFKDVATAIKGIYDKTVALKAEVFIPGSVGEEKYITLLRLWKRCNRATNAFNLNFIEHGQINEKRQALKFILLADLLLAGLRITGEELNILCQHRSYYGIAASFVPYIGSVITGLVTGLLVGGPLLAIPSTYAGHVVGKSQTDPMSKCPTSAKVLIEFLKKIRYSMDILDLQSIKTISNKDKSDGSSSESSFRWLDGDETLASSSSTTCYSLRFNGENLECLVGGASTTITLILNNFLKPDELASLKKREPINDTLLTLVMCKAIFHQIVFPPQTHTPTEGSDLCTSSSEASSSSPSF